MYMCVYCYTCMLYDYLCFSSSFALSLDAYPQARRDQIKPQLQLPHRPHTHPPSYFLHINNYVSFLHHIIDKILVYRNLENRQIVSILEANIKNYYYELLFVYRVSYGDLLGVLFSQGIDSSIAHPYRIVSIFDPADQQSFSTVERNRTPPRANSKRLASIL